MSVETSAAIVLDTNVIIFHRQGRREIIDTIIEHVKDFLEAKPMFGIRVFIPEAVLLELLMVSNWEWFTCGDCHARFRGDFRARESGYRPTMPRHCPLCGSTNINNMGVAITKGEVNDAIQNLVNYLRENMQGVEVRVGEPSITNALKNAWSLLTREFANCRTVLDLLIVESACTLTGGFRSIVLMTSDYDRDRCIRKYLRTRRCGITLYNYISGTEYRP